MRKRPKYLLLATVCLLASPWALAVPRLAFQTYAVRDLCEKDFAGTLKAAKAMGYEGVETGRFFGLNAKGLKAACDEAGLELVALQLYPHNLTEPQLAKTIRFCKECGCKRINVAWYKGSAENPNDWQLLVNVLNHAAEVCAKECISVAYHNHDHEFSMSIGDKCIWDWLFARDGAGGVMRQVSATPRFSNLVFQELDCGNCVLGGGDPCILRYAYTLNAVGRYAEAHEILTTRRFHVWEGADGLLAPFVESCIGLGLKAMEDGRALSTRAPDGGFIETALPDAAAGKYRLALAYFEESTTYPENLQAGRPGDAGTEPKSRYYMAQCKKALGDAAGYKAELENSLKGWIHAGEMDYWRVKALRELGRDAECAPLIAEMRQTIRELETPQPVVINAYAKFAGDNSAMERAAKAREKAGFLRSLLSEIDR